MSTGESKVAVQARLRRERREKKILSQGNSRLEKIAGLQGGATAREALHPEPSHTSTAHVADPPEPDIADLGASTTSSSIRSSELSRNHAHSPNFFGVDGGDEDPFNMLRGENDPFANLPEELRNDPMMKLLLNSPMMGAARGQGSGTGGMGGGGNFLGNSENSSSDDLNNLAEKITKQLLGARAGNGQGGQEQIAQPDTSAWKWKFARIISVLTVLGFLWGQLEDYHFSRDFDISYGIVLYLLFYLICSPYSTHSSCFRCHYKCFVLSWIKGSRFLDQWSRRSDHSFRIRSVRYWLGLHGTV